MGPGATDNAKHEFDLPGLCRSIVEASPLPMAAVQGANHIVRYVNPAFCRLAGQSEEELIGNAFSGIVRAGNECLSLLDRVYRTGQAETHIGPGDSGTVFQWSYAMWPVLAADSTPVGIIIQVSESTPLHQEAVAMNQALLVGSVRQHELTEAANVQLRAELVKRQHAEKVLRRANEDLSQYAFTASHDLREPLRMITSYSQLLMRRYGDQLDANGSLFIGYIAEGTKRMGELLAALLSYARAGADEEEPAELIDFNAVYEKATKNLGAAIAESGAVISCDHLPVVQGHDAHFLQLLQNLIGNAIKYHGEQTPQIHVSAEQLDGEWRFAVTDNGMGIAPEYQQQIFGVFKRLHGKEIPGTGIGLAICQRVVERYGGRIWVESQVDGGATFYFTLPMNSGGLEAAAGYIELPKANLK
jgi:PAS domain S-box-containing protein